MQLWEEHDLELRHQACSVTADKDRAGINPHLTSDSKCDSNVFLTRGRIYWLRSNQGFDSLLTFSSLFFKNWAG
jgi:hypothetical protein